MLIMVNFRSIGAIKARFAMINFETRKNAAAIRAGHANRTRNLTRASGISRFCF
jgi:hypothetical protein